MSLLQAGILVIILLLGVIFYQRSSFKDKLAAQKPVLNLELFEKIYDIQLNAYGEGVAEIIIRTCLATAHELKADVTIHKEMHEEMDASTEYVKNYTTRIANADEKLESRLKRLHKSHQEEVASLRAHQDEERKRIEKIRELHRLI